MDPTLWGLRGRELYERRAYFWNLVVGECWQSLITGRPPAFVASFIDCRMPTEEDEAHYQAGEVQLGCKRERIFLFHLPYSVSPFSLSLHSILPLLPLTCFVFKTFFNCCPL
jgi:hypothetical protein